MEQPDFKQIAAQLRKPSGKDGIETAVKMNVHNGHMIRTCIDHLPLQNGDRILEIGPVGGLHVPYLMNKAKDLTYSGTELSDTMVKLATENNPSLVQAGNIFFRQVVLHEGYTTLPFPDHTFNVAFTVNTLYFWDNAPAQAAELYRVLQPGGTLALCFATETFMSSLPFTQ